MGIKPSKNKKKDKPKKRKKTAENPPKTPKKAKKKLMSPADLETFLRKKHNIPHVINREDMKVLLQNSPEIPHNEAYFLLRTFRDKKFVQTYYELIK